jgi:hypothetical protein
VIAVGARAASVSGTPRSRVGALLTAARPQKTPADVLLCVPAGESPDAAIDELATGLPSLAGRGGAGGKAS